MNALACFKILSVALLLCIPLAACSTPVPVDQHNPTAPLSGSTPPQPSSTPPQPSSTPSVPIAQSNQARIPSSEVSEADLETLADGNNAFALDLYKVLRVSDGNLFYSPYSISLALAMAFGGARGPTGVQMAEVLHLELPVEFLHAGFNQLDFILAQNGVMRDEEHQPMKLDITNAIWAQEDHPFLPGYLDLLALNYGAGIHLADFTTQAEPTRQEINRWISEQTHGRIKDIISPGMLDSFTRMVLVNAIYFKADWQTPFDVNDTYDAPFYLQSGSEVQVEMMSNDVISLPYVDGDGYQAVELPYVGGTAAMDIILPDAGQFESFDAALDWATLESILEEMQPTHLHLCMPKFSFTNQFNLSDQLETMGMPDAFDPERADFSGMDGLRDLYISDVIHQAFVAVDEQGTETAVATIILVPTSPGWEIELVIDRPFFFLIRDLSSGQILFAGRVLNPVD